MNNPLLETDHLPAFSRIVPDQIKPAIEQIITENKQSITSLIAQTNPGWHNLVDPLSLLDDQLNKAWSPVRHMNSVKSSDELRDAYNQCLPLLSEYATELSQNRDLFDHFQHIADSDEYAQLDTAQQKAIDDALKHFRLGGVNLEGEARTRYQQLQKDLSEIQSSFENNLLDANQAWEKNIDDESVFEGLPDYAIAMLKQLAEQKEQTGFRVTLDMPCYIAVITYADNRALREEIYHAYTTRASDKGITDKKWDNSANMVDIVAKRQEKAKLLGFRNYAEYSLETKMATSVDAVISFLEDLAEKSRDAAIEEVNERQQYAETLGFVGELQAWDYAYYSEKLKQQRYKISDEDLKPFFSDQLVIKGLFDIVKALYQIDIREAIEKIDVWNENVRFYQIKN